MGEIIVSTIANIGGKDGSGKFGFINDPRIEHGAGIFFHFSSIDKNSGLRLLVKENRDQLVGTWVCCLIDPDGGRDGRLCAGCVYLLEELTPDFPDEATFCAAVDAANANKLAMTLKYDIVTPIYMMVDKADDALLVEHPMWLYDLSRERLSRFFDSHSDEWIEQLLEAYGPLLTELAYRNIDVNRRLQHPDWWGELPPEKATELFDSIDYTNTDAAYVASFGALLGKVDAVAHAKTAVRIAERMREQGMAYSPAWWKTLTDSLKVRAIIYWSNFPSDKAAWCERLPEISQFEKAREADGSGRASEATIVLTMVEYLGILFIQDPQKKQARFMSAHEKLMKYIIDCFNQGDDVTPALGVLLERCVGNPEQKYFCDGKYWNRKYEGAVVFCPKKTSERYGGRECKFLDSDFEKSSSWNNYTSHLTDFLRNLDFTPDIKGIIGWNYNGSPWQYSFLISGIVNRLVSMRSHMRCKCSSFMTGVFRISQGRNLSITQVACPRSKEPGADPNAHDSVYLNYCKRCGEVIDSRECKIQDESGYWLCMSCGGSNDCEPGERCPSCGHIFTPEERLHNLYSGKKYIRHTDPECGHDGGSDAWSIVGKLNGTEKSSRRG